MAANIENKAKGKRIKLKKILEIAFNTQLYLINYLAEAS